MKKFLALIFGFLLMLSISGCSSLGKDFVQKPQEVFINIKSDQPTKIDTGNYIQRVMAIKNSGPELSSMSFINDGVGYMELWGGLSSYDSKSMWNDLLLFEKVYRVKSISIYLSSGGGSAFDGLSLADEIERISAIIPVTMYASGIVASAAVPIYASANKRISAKGTIFMVHPARAFKLFSEETEKDLITQQVMFKLLKAKYIEKLTKHSTSSKEDWLKREEETTWFDANQAKAWGLVDEIQ